MDGPDRPYGFLSSAWAIGLSRSLVTGTEGAYSLTTAFNQGRWIAEIDRAVWWVYASGGTSDQDLYGEVVLAPVDKPTSRWGAPLPDPTVTFAARGFIPTLVVPAPGTSDAYMVAFVGELASRSIPIHYAWNPAAGSGAPTAVHAPSATVDGTVTTRCGYPAGVVSEDGDQAFVAYTLSDLQYAGNNSDEDPTRRVRLLRVPADGGAPEDLEVEPDPAADGLSHSHFPSVAITRYGPSGHHVVLVVWRSFYGDPNALDNSAIRGRVYFVSPTGISEGDGPFDIASPTEGAVYGSDPSVVGIGQGEFLVAFAAKPEDGSSRGRVYSRTYSVASGAVGALVSVEPDGSAGTAATFPHKFPSLAVDAEGGRVLMAYEVGSSGSEKPHGTRLAMTRVTDPTAWKTMQLADGDADGVCDPTAPVAHGVHPDSARLVGDRGQALRSGDPSTPQQTINPTVLITSDHEAYVAFALRDDMDTSSSPPAGTNTMSLELYSVRTQL